MTRRAGIAFVLTFCLALTACVPKADEPPEQTEGVGDIPPWAAIVEVKGPVSKGWTVSQIIDGDTVQVSRHDHSLTVRLIGIDTPETVAPFEPVECFGQRSTQFAERMLLNKSVFLEFDPSQGRRDVYHRTLAYLWLWENRLPRLFNEMVLLGGFGHEFTYDAAYAWQREFQAAQVKAMAMNRGLWSKC